MKYWLILTALCFALTGCGASGGYEIQAIGTSGQTAGTPIQQINAIRAAAGRKPVPRSAKLDAAARAHAQDMFANGFYDHVGSNGSTVAERVSKTGFSWCSVSENIARGSKYDTAQKVIKGWEASPGHYRNMVNPKARAFGMAQRGDYWVQVFAGNRC